MTRRYRLFRYNETENHISNEQKQALILAYYKDKPYEDFIISPANEAIDLAILNEIRIYLALYSFHPERCQFNPASPKAEKTSKCFIDVINADLENPENKIYAVTEVSLNENDMSNKPDKKDNSYQPKQIVTFFTRKNNSLRQMEHSEVIRCPVSGESSFNSNADFVKHFMNNVTLSDPATYLLKIDKDVYHFSMNCNPASEN